ncbi:MAG TPA: fatty acyl-AMP ligase, partial [Rhodocyclaceae bacterium]|nr:fatty acyl-AMP ligase [Rhodocyclaceae bacterium]
MNARDDVVTLVDLLRFRAARTPQRMAYTFLRDGVHEDAVFTYAGLDRAARAIAAELIRTIPTAPAGVAGERAVLIYPPGLEFIAAFFGCLYAGMIPIPAPPPDGARMKRTFPRLLGIMEDSGSQIVMSTDAIYRNALSALGDDQTVRWLCSDTVAIDADTEPHRGRASDVAYLQYTSGSTSTPKGVVLTHANVLADLAMSERAWDYSADSVSVTWMPYFHDYGLVDGLLQPLYSGNPCYVLSPLNFIKRPQRWLEAISRYRGTHTQAPNFAYELCLHKVTTAQRDALDLSRWKIASNGAEPVRESTMQRFIDYFAPCGFHSLAYSPSYGLAEATLMVSTKTLGQAAIVRHLDAATLERDHKIADIIDSDDLAAARSVVGCGAPPREVTVAIVDPDTCRRCAVDEVGEIWVSSPAVAVGYWAREEESRAIFYARLVGEAADEANSAAYLRTGDLGFMQDGEVYVTGRLKDLIIIAGVNHYPQDIEWTVQQSHSEFRPDHCAAFSVEEDGEERLVVVAEVNRELPDWQPLFDAVRRAVSETHEMELHALVVLRKGGIL